MCISFRTRGERRRTGALLVGCVLAAVACLGACGGAPAPARGAPASAGSALPELGVDAHLDRIPADQRRPELARLAAMGAKWVRLGAPWYELQPSEGRLDDGRLAELVGTVEAATSVGLRVLVIGDQAPDWAGGGDATASHPPAYGEFMGALAERLRGSGPGHTSPAYELMNEPDGVRKESAPFGAKTWATPSDYAHAACAAFHAIKARDSTATVAAGSLDVTNWRGWLRSAFDAGLGGCFDVLSAHPYSGLSVLNDIRDLAARQGTPNATIWVTELGESTCGDPLLGCVSEAEQANHLVDSLRELGREYRWVPVAMVYEARDEPHADGDAAQRSFGLFRTAGDSAIPKPAVAALRELYGRR